MVDLEGAKLVDARMEWWKERMGCIGEGKGMRTLMSLFDWTLMASKGVVSGSGPSMANGRFVEM